MTDKIEINYKGTMIKLTDDCTSRCLKKKSDSGREVDDQDIAICITECKEGIEKGGSSTDQPLRRGKTVV